MSDEQKDKRLKYVDIPKVFYQRANDLDIACKQSQRRCENMAKQLATRKPKTAEEFERVENLKQFVMSTATLNEKALQLIQYVQGLLTEVAGDAQVLCEGAVIQDRLKDQSDTIELLTKQRDKFANDYINQCRTSKANTEQPA